MRRAVLWLSAVLCAAPAMAETVYVTDQVTVALRADAAADAVVLKTVATGTALELLERGGSFAKVRDREGTEGWIEAAAIVPQPPAAQQLKALRAELERTRAQLVNAQTQLDKARTAAPELASVRAELAKTREELAAAQTQLKQKEEEMAALAAAREATRAAPPSPTPEGRGFSFLWAGIAFAMLLLGFIAGIVWVRESIRRRMGGMYLRI